MHNAVSAELLSTIKELQFLPALQSFALAGGTNLALRFNHRSSIDIDLFSDTTIGIAGMKAIANELANKYTGNLLVCEIINEESGEQFCFLRALIRQGDTTIKVEMIQNIMLLDPIEFCEGIRVLSKRDIGVLKLMSASSRKANKDIYDLDFITEHIGLSSLLGSLQEKRSKYHLDEHKCLFDLDNEPSPTDNIGLLLEYDKNDYTASASRPFHSSDRIDIIPGNKDWGSAKRSWNRKVRDEMKKRGIPPPPLAPIN